jgi:hypothetical protein
VTCICHHDDTDGFTAAWVWYQPGDTLIAIDRGRDDMSSIPDGSDVVILDYCPARAELEALATRCNVRVLDHHKTALACADLPYVTVNVLLSGCMLAWAYAPYGTNATRIPTVTMFRTVQYAQDYDLWRFDLPDSREINSVLNATPRTLAAYDQFAIRLAETPLSIVEEGRVRLAEIRRLAEKCCEKPELREGVPYVNAPWALANEVCDILLARGAAYAVSWYYEQGRYRYSLRSNGSVDVSVISAWHGGGGHVRAAGCSCSELRTL